MGHFSATDENLGFQSRPPIPGLNHPSNQLGNAFSGAGSGLIREGLGAYGKRICGSSSQYVQSNIIKCFSDPQYYFQVNAHYIRNKLKIILFPFLHRGHWTRITEPIGGRLSYNPPINDINAPDLYIPFMTFATYLVLAGISLGLSGNSRREATAGPQTRSKRTRARPKGRNRITSTRPRGLALYPASRDPGAGAGRGEGRPARYSLSEQDCRRSSWIHQVSTRPPGLGRNNVRFSPEALNWQFVKGMACWLFQAMLLKASLTSLGGGEAPLLDMIAYAGYTFTGLCVAVVGRITLSYAYHLIVIWTSMCSGIFLAKMIRLTLHAEARRYDVAIHNYLLLGIAFSPFPFIFCLSNPTGN